MTRWDLLFDYPLSILSYPGGTKELYIATIATVVFEWRKRDKHSHCLGFALLRQLILDQGHLLDMLFAFVLFLLVVLVKWGVGNIAIASSVGVLLGLVYRSPELMGYRIDVWFYIIISLLVWTYIWLGSQKLKDNRKRC
ncbi:hypothetical protein [Halobacillus karajensis]|uniref:hypothetical protein n=1 Tax=Halobacillus karajensis TaxID=195088 RepID=UPI0012DC48D7|nr:hypothetical protein [Halobacillus karajensis]